MFKITKKLNRPFLFFLPGTPHILSRKGFCPSIGGKKSYKMEGQSKMGFPFVIGNESVPDITKEIFKLLDHKTLSKVRQVSKEWKHEVDQETSFWSDIYPVNGYRYRKAVKENRLDIIRNLIDYAQDPNPANEAGLTLLHQAAWHGNIEVCKLLQEHVGNKNPRDKYGRTPLHHAALKGHAEMCKLLLEDGADKNPRDDRGWTPLHKAAFLGKAEVCKVLLQNGADKNPRDNAGRTPLDDARRGGRQNVIALLSQ